MYYRCSILKDKGFLFTKIILCHCLGTYFCNWFSLSCPFDKINNIPGSNYLHEIPPSLTITLVFAIRNIANLQGGAADWEKTQTPTRRNVTDMHNYRQIQWLLQR